MRTVPLHGKIAAGRVALVDDEDYDLVKQYRWHAIESSAPNHKVTYARTSWGPRRGQTFMHMHNLIMGQLSIDHRDHDGLNNQRGNLRPTTQSQNNANSRPRSGTSRFRGVHWDRRENRWQAEITVSGSHRRLGCFKVEEDAAHAYDVAAVAAWGEFATLNFPERMAAP